MQVSFNENSTILLIRIHSITKSRTGFSTEQMVKFNEGFIQWTKVQLFFKRIHHKNESTIMIQKNLPNEKDKSLFESFIRLNSFFFKALFR